MTSNRVDYIRGIVGTALTWGLLWSALNTIMLFARWLPTPPEHISRGRMAVAILANQSVNALLWGTVLGALFSVTLTYAAARWPSERPLDSRRLAWVGAVAGLGLSVSVVHFGSWFEIAATVVISVVSAGVGALLGSIAERAQRKVEAGSTAARIASAQ